MDVVMVFCGSLDYNGWDEELFFLPGTLTNSVIGLPYN